MAKPRRSAPAVARQPQRRSGHVGLVLLGAAALGVGTAWSINLLNQRSCDPNVDPQCQERTHGGSSGSGYYGGWGSSSSSRSAGSSPSGIGSTERGGFGSTGRSFFSFSGS